MKKILIVEDDEIKLLAIKKIFSDQMFEVDTAGSFKEAQKKIFSCPFDLIVLDMSLPTFDKSAVEKGGKWRTFGGEEILDEIHRYNVVTKVFVVSGYDKLGVGSETITFWELKKRLKLKYTGVFIGGAYFDPFKSDWQNEIKRMLKEELK